MDMIRVGDNTPPLSQSQIQLEECVAIGADAQVLVNDDRPVLRRGHESEQERQLLGVVQDAVPGSKTTQRILAGLLMITCCLLVAVAVVAGLKNAKDSSRPSGSGSSSGSLSSNDYCTSMDCLRLAADLSASINTSVEPCDDFYHVCSTQSRPDTYIYISQHLFSTCATDGPM